MAKNPRQLLTRADVVEMIGAQVYRDAIKAGWIAPRAIKAGRTPKKNAKIIFALEDVERVEKRILAGEYPAALPTGNGHDYSG